MASSRFLFSVIVALVITSTLTTPRLVQGQALPSFGSIEGRLGGVKPEKAKLGIGGGVELDLGYLGSPAFRTLFGVTYFKADVDRRTVAGPVGGSLSSWGAHAGVRLDPLAGQLIAPYALALVGAQRVRANVQDPGVAELIDSFNTGVGLGGGLAVAVDSAHTVSVTADIRRIFVSGVSHTRYEAGIRYAPHGPAAYATAYRDDWDRRERDRLRAEQEALLARQRADQDAQLARQRELDRTRQATDTAMTESDRLKLEREKLEAERLRLEQERAQTERQRGEQAAVGQRLKAQQHADSLRARADSLEAARKREAEARAAAEQEAAAARARAAAADSALQTQRRAADADQKLYTALVDLDRQSSTVTAIRGTDRGLAIVLGQGAFASGRATLSPQARAEISRVASELSSFPEHRLAVEGYTDAAGSEVANQRLSEQRADAVAAALVAAGIEPSRIDKAGYGSSRPLADNATAAGRAQNRRVEIVVLGSRPPAARP